MKVVVLLRMIFRNFFAHPHRLRTRAAAARFARTTVHASPRGARGARGACAACSASMSATARCLPPLRARRLRTLSLRKGERVAERHVLVGFAMWRPSTTRMG